MSRVGTATGAIQKAIVTKLKADDGLTLVLVGGIKDFRNVPRGTQYPYLTVGDMTEVEGGSSFGEGEGPIRGYDDTITLHAWSIQPGTEECQGILGMLNNLLDGKPLVLDALHHAGTWYQFSNILPDPADSRISHLVVRYRVGAEELNA